MQGPYGTLEEITGYAARFGRLDAALAEEPRTVLDIARLGIDLRRRMVENYLCDRLGDTVQSGPFAGMRLNRASSGSLFGARLLGCYEEELHPLVHGMGRYRRVLNVGCAEGWYAVGLARLHAGLEIVAFDISAVARQHCAALARDNGVAGRIDIRAAFDAAQLAGLAGPDTLVLMDIEGGETALLPSLAPADIGRCDWLVECHTLGARRTIDDVTGWLGPSHDLTVIPQTPRLFSDHPVLAGLGQLDRFLAQWEGRGAEPWIMARTRGEGV